MDALSESPGASGAASPASAPSTAATRAFVRHWRRADFPARLPDAEAGAAARGRAVLEAASCLRCHAVDGEGGRTGPGLREAAARHAQDALLTHLLDPSAEIAEGYGAELFFLADGGVLSGRVVAEDDDTVSVQDDPYREAPRVLRRGQIAERRVSQVSVMPEGLLSTFTREEILDLIAWLDAQRPDAAER
jgi:putative heme-binding domain-containing protein